MERSVEHDEADCRFTLMVDGQQGGYLSYVIRDNCLDIQRIFVNEELRGKGSGEVLAYAAADYAEKKALRVIPTCSYAKKILVLGKM